MRLKKPSFSTFYFTSVAILFLFSLSLNAQTDSLQGKSYKELIKLYQTVLFSNPSDATVYATEAKRVAQQKNDQGKVAESLYCIAFSTYYLAEYDASLHAIEQSIQISKKRNNYYLLFENYNLKGNILSDLEKEFEALDEYLLAKKYADLTGKPIHSITVSVNIAHLKKSHNNPQEALVILKESLALLEKVADGNREKLRYKRIILMNIADTYLRMKNITDAENYNNLAMESCVGAQTNLACLIILMNDGIINYQKKNYDKTIIISKKVEKGFIELKNENQLVTPYFYLGKSYFQKEEYTETITYLEKALAIVSENKMAFSDQKEVHQLLRKSYIKVGDEKKAEEHFNYYDQIDRKDDSINTQLNNTIYKKYEIDPLKEEITSLGNDNLKQQKRAKYLYALLGVLAITFIGFFIWFKQKQKQNKKRFQELLVTIEKLEQPKEKITSDVLAKENSNPVTDKNALQILKDLEIFEEKELYLRQDCTLSYVAKKLKTNTSYLSNVINTYKEKSFKAYLSELRINAALIKLKNDSKLRSYTIKAIAKEFGFKRSETFSRAFKSQTSMYPSYYIKNLQNQKDT
ncbi:AraC family transcriptional regulator [Kordia sp. YSTF-M3]|uniref:AraC family transcriptional regulator n=1 Tax=Kordia aestuariivivens TaxID=2759037 RepID=A0ABR7QGC4_9FLAO|nr:AraC family transcriptional regulator [Kordia aestuariivivens]MBC8757601.1 AraC family transcriptional regulator [Kordia aestuariivivens]